jgi:hypothetical protein
VKRKKNQNHLLNILNFSKHIDPQSWVNIYILNILINIFDHIFNILMNMLIKYISIWNTINILQ